MRRLSRRVAGFAFAAAALALSVGTAKSDTITIFDVSATFVSTGTGACPGCTLGGKVVIDVTNGLFEPGNEVTMAGEPPSVGPFSVPIGGILFGVSLGQSHVLENQLNLIFPNTGSSLVGYPGGPICGTDTSLSLGGDCLVHNAQPLFSSIQYVQSGTVQVWDIASGSLTPEPLPAALPLFATGIGGLGLLGWRRKRKVKAGA
jgi:hypothetical protein